MYTKLFWSQLHQFASHTDRWSSCYELKGVCICGHKWIHRIFLTLHIFSVNSSQNPVTHFVSVWGLLNITERSLCFKSLQMQEKEKDSNNPTTCAKKYLLSFVIAFASLFYWSVVNKLSEPIKSWSLKQRDHTHCPFLPAFPNVQDIGGSLARHSSCGLKEKEKERVKRKEKNWENGGLEREERGKRKQEGEKWGL